MPNWLYARTHKFLGITGLIVYRSVAMRDDDALYWPVQQVVESDQSELISKEKVQDSEMMFGAAELSTYMIGALEIAAEAFDLWMQDLHAECRRITHTTRSRGA